MIYRIRTYKIEIFNLSPGHSNRCFFFLNNIQTDMLRSILGLFTAGKATTVWHLGHFGLFFITNTYDKHPGHPTATGHEAAAEAVWSQTSSSSGDLRFFNVPDETLPALSRADFTLSSVQTLWKLELVDDTPYREEDDDDDAGGDDGEEGTSFSSRLVSSKRLNNGLAGDMLGKFKSWSLWKVWLDCSARRWWWDELVELRCCIYTFPDFKSRRFSQPLGTCRSRSTSSDWSPPPPRQLPLPRRSRVMSATDDPCPMESFTVVLSPLYLLSNRTRELTSAVISESREIER